MMELTRVCFRGPEVEARPSRQVALLVRAPLRRALASATLDDLSLDTDFWRASTETWCKSLQSWSDPLCFSMRSEDVVVASTDESFVASSTAAPSEWRRKLRRFGSMSMEMESFNVLKQTSGYGVVLHIE
uniref:Uncharacterized protein n=1 Tax=Opuntia streptacantha TaxID=393608 RepID=A0A7C9DQG3_OPUST